MAHLSELTRFETLSNNDFKLVGVARIYFHRLDTAQMDRFIQAMVNEASQFGITKDDPVVGAREKAKEELKNQLTELVVAHNKKTDQFNDTVSQLKKIEDNPEMFDRNPLIKAMGITRRTKIAGLRRDVRRSYSDLQDSIVDLEIMHPDLKGDHKEEKDLLEMIKVKPRTKKN